jgi:NAD-dependent dihydropyrimidine dehydrogenase PreA subunit
MRTGFDTLVTTPLDMSLNTTPCVSCGRCAETCPTGALMPKPRVLEKYDVDESRCILCGICVDACPYDALRCGPDFELSHESRADPMIDLMAISAMDRDTELSYVRRERDWAIRAGAGGRGVPEGRLLPMLPPGAVASAVASSPLATNAAISGNGHGSSDGHGHGNGSAGNGFGGTHAHAK